MRHGRPERPEARSPHRRSHRRLVFHFRSHCSAVYVQRAHSSCWPVNGWKQPRRWPAGPPDSADLDMRIGMTTYGFLFSASLVGALESIARAGFKLVEITPSPPHMSLTNGDRGSRLKLVRKLEQLQLACVSINPTE